MAGGIGPFAGRLVFLCACPVVAWLAGCELDVFVVAISALACVLELSLFTCYGTSGKKARHSIRPARFFPVQLCLLYCIQLWLFMLHHSIVDHRHGTITEDHDASEHAATHEYAAADSPALVAEAQQEPAQVSASHSGGLPNAAEKASHNVGSGGAGPTFVGKASGDAPAVPAATLGSGGGFRLDVPLEELRWNPKTISVVLPCAEERDFAFKTVKSFFETTPSEVLHEIVVVDDGSDPPLSQTHLQPDVQRQYKVKICRHENTVGLIGAKKTGGDVA